MPPPPFIPLTVVAVAVWLVWAWLAHKLLKNPRQNRWDATWYGLGLGIVRLYARIIHRVRYIGRQHIPASSSDRPLIVVVNHTAGVDPVLVSAALPFEIRWMMARDMMLPALDGWWRWIGVIPVDRPASGATGSDPGAAREAIRILQSGQVVGVFPEGGIERPVRTLRPFAPGVGLLIRRTNARVLPVLIEDTPQTETAFGSLLAFSHAKVTFLPIVDFAGAKLSAEAMTQRLVDLYQSATGWPVQPAECAT